MDKEKTLSELEDMLNEDNSVFIEKPKTQPKKNIEKPKKQFSKIESQLNLQEINPVLIIGGIVAILIIIICAGLILIPSNPPIDFDDSSIEPTEGECVENKDCDDRDVSTTDWCIETPKKCFNIPIKTCVSGDDYCPSKCDTSNDNDCEAKDEKTCVEQNGFECSNSEYCSKETFETIDIVNCCPANAECIPTDACDTVTCQTYERCENGICIAKSCQEINGVICDENNTCFDSLVATSDSFNCCLGQCVPIIGCGEDSDCDDTDESTLDSCTGEEQKFCSNTEITWCASGDDYCPEDCVFEDDADCYEPPAPPDLCEGVTCESNETCSEGNCLLKTCSDFGQVCEEGNICDGESLESEDATGCCVGECVPEYLHWFSAGENLFDGCAELDAYEEDLVDIEYFKTLAEENEYSYKIIEIIDFEGNDVMSDRTSYAWDNRVIPTMWQCYTVERVILDEEHPHHDEVFSAWKKNLAENKENFETQYFAGLENEEAEANMLWLTLAITSSDWDYIKFVLNRIVDDYDTVQNISTGVIAPKMASGEYNIYVGPTYVGAAMADLDGDGTTNNAEFINLARRNESPEETIVTKENYLNTIFDSSVDGTN